jgi:hypothetical protein
LVAAGADLNSATNDGMTSLMFGKFGTFLKINYKFFFSIFKPLNKEI